MNAVADPTLRARHHGPGGSRAAGGILDHITLQDGTERWSEGQNVLEARFVAPGVLWMRFVGFGDAAFVPTILAWRTRLLAQQPQGAILFDDMERTTGYAAEARSALTHWVRTNRKSLGGIHILTHNRLVAMGVSVANLALGGFLTAYTDPAAFSAAVKRVSAERATSPAPAR